jgi:GH43 family beta-xylosidase
LSQSIPAYTGYLLVHFIGEQPDGEQVYFSYSEDGLHFKDLNAGLPVLRSELGEKGARDPFIIRSPKESKFYLIATDLRIASGKGWGAAVEAGSRDIIVWESADLVNWSQPWAVTVGVEGAGCVWAPEAIYDEAADEFLVFWASATQEPHESERKHKIYSARTKNFREFTAAEKYIERDNHIIDTTIIAAGGRYYRFSKDETTKNIRVEQGASLDKDAFSFVDAPVLEAIMGVEGPEIYKLNGRGEWCLIVDRYAEGKGYLPLLTSDLSSGDFRVLADREFDLGVNTKRHGGVLPVTAGERSLLLAAFGDGHSYIMNETITNPVVLQRADPCIYRHSDGYYYFTASVPEYDRIELRRARTIGGLTASEPVVIWTKHTTGIMSGYVWAPEIHYISGKWYIYFSAGSDDAPFAQRLYVLENASDNPLEGSWEEKGRIYTAWDTFSLDATTFAHAGSQYLVWAQEDPSVQGNSSLFISKMANPWTLEGEQILLTRPDYEWETIGYRVNEGPAVMKKNGRVLLTYSASATDHHYCMGLLTAPDDSNLLDPGSWTKSPVPVFTTSEENGQYGPGHNSFTVTADGTQDLLVYHARNYKEIEGDPLNDPNRHTRVQPVAWGEDGLPVFGLPVPDGHELTL